MCIRDSATTPRTSLLCTPSQPDRADVYGAAVALRPSTLCASRPSPLAHASGAARAWRAHILAPARPTRVRCQAEVSHASQQEQRTEYEENNDSCVHAPEKHLNALARAGRTRFQHHDRSAHTRQKGRCVRRALVRVGCERLQIPSIRRRRIKHVCSASKADLRSPDTAEATSDSARKVVQAPQSMYLEVTSGFYYGTQRQGWYAELRR
eukprot:5180197-Pleurochrysis_carterae.AAC.3